MTGLEPHPIFKIPDNIRSKADFEEMRLDRLRLMQMEVNNPYLNGWKSPLWGLIDDMLVEGKEIELVGREYLEIPPEIAKSKTPSLKIIGRRDLLIHGANGAGKTEYAARKMMEIDVETAGARTWSYHETAPVSIARQHPLLWKYMPPEWRPSITGKLRQGVTANISYTVKNGFTENSFVLPNGSQHWFKNYAQEEQIIEGDQLNACWFDELVPLSLVKTVRFRLVRRKGILIITFTPIKGWNQTVQEYRQGARTIVEATAKLLPNKDEDGKPTGTFEKVPRVQVAGPGTDGNLKANVIYLHSDDNPYFDKSELYEVLRGARRQLILERAYGVATRAFANQFPKFSETVHTVDPWKIPKYGTRYHIVDPCEGRNWFSIWMLVDPSPVVLKNGAIMHRRWIYREFPSTGHPNAYIAGIADPGPWTLPGNAADGERGPAQDNWGWGLARYKRQFDLLEGVKINDLASLPATGELEAAPRWNQPKANPVKHGRKGLDAAIDEDMAGGELIYERRMDSRAGATPTQTQARVTTLIDLMLELDMVFYPASGREIGEGIQKINNLLDYDSEVEIGDYSPALGRINGPLLYVSKECPNLIYSLREWTGKDKEHGASKDPVDVLRYAVEDELDYIPEDMNTFVGGGTY